MTKPIIGDIFIGDFPVTQGYGGNPDMYKQFGLAGHNGIDFGTPDGTQIIAATDGVVVRVGWDQYGYGNYVEVWDKVQQCATLYAHLKSISVQMNQEVVRGQLLGFSDNTGNSTGPHLHFGYCRTDEQGVRTNKDNGYSGWINPNAYATWDIKNLTEPVKPINETDPLVCDKKSVRDMLVTKASAYDAQKPTYTELTNLNSEVLEQLRGANSQNKTYDGLMTQFASILNVEKQPAVIAGELTTLVGIQDKWRTATKERDDAIEREKIEIKAREKAEEVATESNKKALTATESATEAEKKLNQLSDNYDKLVIDYNIIKSQRKEISKYSIKELRTEINTRIWNACVSCLKKIFRKQ